MPEPIVRDMPMDWTCDDCGATSADAAVIRPATTDWMNYSDHDLLDATTPAGLFYGYGIHADPEKRDVTLCGECGCARWSAPGEEAPDA